VAGSGTEVPAVAVNETPPWGHNAKSIEKLCPAGIPRNEPPTPDRKIVVTPPTVFTLQFINALGELHEIASAGTPDSTSFRLVQLRVVLFEKKRVPVPLFGDEKVKCVPTGVQVPVQTGSLTMILGSGTEFANAEALANNKVKTHKTRVLLINPSFGKYCGVLLPQLGKARSRVGRAIQPCQVSTCSYKSQALSLSSGLIFV
jgi:hypothetical protein